MKYTRPEVVALGSALKAIQSDTLKALCIIFDSFPLLLTLGIAPAYEADE